MKLKKRIKQNEIDIDRIDVETVRLDKNYETAAQTPAADPSTITTTSTDTISVNEATTAAIQRHFTTWCFFILFQTYESGTMKKSRMGFEDEYHNDKSNNRVINNNHDDNTTTNNNNNDNNNNVQMSQNQ